MSILAIQHSCTNIRGTAREEKEKKRKDKSQVSKDQPQKILQGRARPLLIGPYYLPSNKGAKNTASVGL
jgi:hypothetical protein